MKREKPSERLRRLQEEAESREAAEHPELRHRFEGTGFGRHRTNQLDDELRTQLETEAAVARGEILRARRGRRRSR